jgi:glycosyltransferase involved in cell wall biosynthesis
VVIDDGSTDKTVKVAKKMGIKHFVIHKQNEGLASAFADGMDKALELGADIIVNTDGDNQYPQEDIPRLIKPIIDNKADIVIADRQTDKIRHFSLGKKILQKIGSAIVRTFSDTKVTDAVSGFRAYSREAALHLNIFTDYTYTIETIIQAGKKKLKIVSIPVKTRPKKRDSRLIKNLWSYLKISTATTLRFFAIYEPLKVFGYMAIIITFPGILIFVRFIYLFIHGDAGAHLQSLIFGVLFILVGAQVGMLGIIADLIAINRKKYENILYRIKKIELKK